MSQLLYRIGIASARHGWRVVLAWAAILALAAGAFAVGFGSLSNSFDIPGTASSRVVDELQRELPEFSGASGMVVLHTDDGSAFTEQQRDAVAGLVARASSELPDVANVLDPFATERERQQRLAELEQGRAQLDGARQQLDAAEALGAGGPELDASRAELDARSSALETGASLLELADGIRLVSDDGSVALITIAFTEPRLELAEASKQAVVDFFEANPISGVSVEFSTEIAQGVPALFGLGEAVGLVIAALVLLVMLGSLVAAALPLVTAVTGVGIGVLASLAFSGVVQMASITPVLGVMLGLAVGIDYCLFIVNRHRRQLSNGAGLVESIAMANGTAGNAVLFAGTTVIVALLALNLTGIAFLGVMGTVGAVCVAIAVLIAVTLTPALLGLVGERVLGARSRARLARTHAAAGAVEPMSTLRAVVVVLVTTVALVTIAVPAVSMRLGLPDGSSEPQGSTTQRAHELVADAFGEGANAALLVTVSLPAALDELETMGAQLEVAAAIAELDDVVAVAPVAVADDGILAAFQVVPAEGPNAESTELLVQQLRHPGLLDGTTLAAASVGVAGQAAINIDVSDKLADVLPLFLVVVVGLSLIIMIVVFRSLLVPLVATLGFVLSLLATYGAIVAVFQWGWAGAVFGVSTPGPVLSFLPVILAGILFGLAMDYQLFLATGMREAFVHGSPARLAVAQGFRAGRAVVIAAALIMVSVFGGFVFTESIIIRSVGFGLAVGVLLDAFVVRLLLMPAIMHLLGRAAWWMPGWLDRILPDVDVEGAALERTHGLGHATTPAER